MTRPSKYGIDTAKLRKKAEERANKFYTDTESKEYKDFVRMEYNNLYNFEAKRIKSERSTGVLKLIRDSAYNLFLEHDLQIYGNDEIRVSLTNEGYKKLIVRYLKSILPEIEKELGITGIKIRSNITPLSQNLLDFSNITVVTEGECE